jgi:RimJ/RimL family protein N-acetyltransferase
MTTLIQGEVARGERVVLREKRLGDAVNDYRWRSNGQLTRYDAARPLTMSFQEYLAFYREELLYPSPYRRTLAIEDEKGRHIGNVMYYNVDALRQDAEIGITIGETESWGRGYGTEALRVLAEHLLERSGFRRLHLKTLAWNRRAQRCFEKVGFAEYAKTQRGGHSFVLMELRREWLAEDAAEDAAAGAG